MKKIFKKKTLTLFCIILILIAIFSIQHERKYHISLPFQVNSNNHPFINVNIENNLHPIEVNIGSRYPFLLSKSVLDKLKNKKFKKTEKWWNVTGDLYYLSSYLLPKLQIENMQFKNITAWEKKQELPKDLVKVENISLGMIGSFLRKYNLLFDFEKRLFCISNDKRKLKTLGYDLKDFFKIPFEMCENGIIMRFYSDLGMKNYLLSTGSRFNFIRSSFFIEKACDQEIYGTKVFSTTKFATHYVMFNKPRFFIFDFDEKIPIDGILGIEFLSRHIFYIDFKNRNIYFKK